MHLTAIQIQHLRNIADARLDLSPGMNIIAGPNGSGKTSLLEAIYLLGRGRSFRSRHRNSLVQADFTQALVVGSLQHNTSRHRLACQITRQDRQMRLDGKDIRRSAKLAQFFPLQFINQQSLDLVDRGPAPRRKFLDWGVFHVEPAFFPAWQRYQRVLQQRNAALRQRQALSAWNTEFVAAGEALHEYRLAYLKDFIPVYEETRDMLLCMDVELHYARGWDEQLGLQASLAQQIQADQVRRFTHSGPHRADLVLEIDSEPANERLSRGQQKLLVASLALAQARLFSRRSERPCVVLVDDLTAELDKQHITLLLDTLIETGAQVFVTVTDAGLLGAVQAAGQRLFHVEQGRFSRVEVV